MQALFLAPCGEESLRPPALPTRKPRHGAVSSCLVSHSESAVGQGSELGRGAQSPGSLRPHPPVPACLPAFLPLHWRPSPGWTPAALPLGCPESRQDPRARACLENPPSGSCASQAQRLLLHGLSSVSEGPSPQAGGGHRCAKHQGPRAPDGLCSVLPPGLGEPRHTGVVLASHSSAIVPLVGLLAVRGTQLCKCENNGNRRGASG